MNYLMNKDQEDMWNKLKEPAPIIDNYGTQCWYNKDGEFHRDNDLPAVIWKDGSKFWYKNGQLHRDNDMPARTCANGYKEWWVNGERHRENNLPSWIAPDGRKEWWINGEYITERHVEPIKRTSPHHRQIWQSAMV